MFESFPSIAPRTVQTIRRRRKIFLDSGAFSNDRQNSEVTMVEYGEFICEYPDIIEVAASLDVIEPGNEQRSYDQFK